jgi:hypothetical protein
VAVGVDVGVDVAVGVVVGLAVAVAASAKDTTEVSRTQNSFVNWDIVSPLPRLPTCWDSLVSQRRLGEVKPYSAVRWLAAPRTLTREGKTRVYHHAALLARSEPSRRERAAFVTCWRSRTVAEG